MNRDPFDTPKIVSVPWILTVVASAGLAAGVPAYAAWIAAMPPEQLSPLQQRVASVPPYALAAGSVLFFAIVLTLVSYRRCFVHHRASMRAKCAYDELPEVRAFRAIKDESRKIGDRTVTAPRVMVELSDALGIGASVGRLSGALTKRLGLVSSDAECQQALFELLNKCGGVGIVKKKDLVQGEAYVECYGFTDLGYRAVAIAVKESFESKERETVEV